MERFVCIHGHFYQPPRENAWLEAVEVQDSAYPYHDWNERITDEGYAPNAASRILDGEGRIVDIVNNYQRISFNMGPTLLSWMEKARPSAYRAIIDAHQKSRERFGGHGSALAQVYNHMIMPLAHDRDKRTQVLWGLADFRHRFGGDPEGMWLPETAADVASLEALAEQGIAFTILAPRQAARVRPLDAGDDAWQDVSDARVDPRQPYLCRLPSGRSIVLFFYDGPISQELGFGNLLDSGENFVNRLLGAFVANGDGAQLVHIATDGETYGHHKPHGDMALAFGLHRLEHDGHARLTVYGEYLAAHPPVMEARIHDGSSWSCVHGVERWRADCGCNSGRPGWHQGWRGPLRAALDWLRDRLAPIYEEQLGELLDDPWAARDAYVEVVLDRSLENVHRFLERQGGADLTHDQQVRALCLLEMQRNAMLMYTSCGWFFDEISGTETQQVLQYAARALQLGEQVSDRQLEPEFVERLREAPSNLPEFGDGAGVYERLVKPARLDLLRVAAHYAVSSLFFDYADAADVYCYDVASEGIEKLRAGRLQLATGRAKVTSRITWESLDMSFAALYLGGHILNGGVREFRGEEELAAMRTDVAEAFDRGEIGDVIRAMDDHFGSHSYSMWHLFRDEQRKVFEPILGAVLEDLENHDRHIYENHYALLKAMRDLGMPRPPALLAPLEFVLNRDLQRLFDGPAVDTARLAQAADELAQVDVPLDRDKLALQAAVWVTEATRRLATNPRQKELLENLRDVLRQVRELGLAPRLWEAQNTYFRIATDGGAALVARAGGGDAEPEADAGLFAEVGELLGVKVR